MKYLLCLTVACIFVFSSVLADNEKPDSEKKGTASKEEVKKYQKRKTDNPVILIETDFGKMKLELFRDVAPIHVDSMLSRIKEGFYDGLIFHRIIDGFMIQGGDPLGTGRGNAGYMLPAEFSDVPHLEGTLSMARGRADNSASCQFFICLARTPHLDGKYTVFGQLMEGYEALQKIGKVEVGGPQKSKPVKDVYIRKMTILGDKAPQKKK
jgi:cyclophilin family peptidyl-prolyl cis-trans isomerase